MFKSLYRYEQAGRDSISCDSPSINKAFERIDRSPVSSTLKHPESENRMGVYAAFWQNAFIVYKEVTSNVAFIVDGPTCSDTEID